MREKTILFYLDETLAEETNLQAGDRLIVAGKLFAVIRNEQRLFAKKAGSEKPADNEFKMDGHPVHAALNLGEEHGLSPHLTTEKIYGGDREWEFAKR